jgi:ADP-ribose pyrophosphatase YjhB (NUDIX family)
MSASPDKKNDHAVATIGAGAILAKGNRYLLVQLNYGKFRGHWILPGGMVEPSEFPADAAKREFFEETSIEIEIQSLVSIRHRKESGGRANIYFVFMGNTAKSEEEVTKLLKWPEAELQSVKFWDFDEILKSEWVRPLTKRYIQMSKKGTGLSISSEITEFQDQIYGLE